MRPVDSIQAVSFLLTVASLAANRPTVNRTGGCRSGAAFRPSPSPIDIAEVDAAQRIFGASLGIPAKLRPASSSVFLAAPREIDCTTGCNARIVNSPPSWPTVMNPSSGYAGIFKQTCRFPPANTKAPGLEPG